MVFPSVPFARKVINDIEEQQRKTFKNTVEGIIRSTNTSPILQEEGKEEEVITPSSNLLQVPTTQADTQEETLQPEFFKNRRHWHQTDLYLRRPKCSAYRRPEYRTYKWKTSIRFY